MYVTLGVAGVGLTSPHRELHKDTQDTRLLYWEYCPQCPLSSSDPGVPLAGLPDDHVKNSGEEEGCRYSIIVNIWVMSALEMWESWVRPSEGLGLLPGGSACSPGQARGRQTAATVFIIRSTPSSQSYCLQWSLCVSERRERFSHFHWNTRNCSFDIFRSSRRRREEIIIMGNILSLFFPQQPAVSAKTQVDH